MTLPARSRETPERKRCNCGVAECIHPSKLRDGYQCAVEAAALAASEARCKELEAEHTALKEQVETWRDRYLHCPSIQCPYERRMDEAIKRAEAAEARLRAYGQHKTDCGIKIKSSNPTFKMLCTCGFSAATEGT